MLFPIIPNTHLVTDYNQMTTGSWTISFDQGVAGRAQYQPMAFKAYEDSDLEAPFAFLYGDR